MTIITQPGRLFREGGLLYDVRLENTPEASLKKCGDKGGKKGNRFGGGGAVPRGGNITQKRTG